MRRALLCFQAIFLACTVLAILLTPSAASAATCEKWAGKVVSLQGTVDAKIAGGTEWQPAKLHETYCPGDTLRTGRRSRAEVALENHPVLRLDESSTITFGGMKDERTSLVDMLSGAALFFSRVTRNLEVRTATVNAGVEGTEFFIRVEEGKTELSIFEGKVLASNEAGSLAVVSGQSAVAEAGKAPVYRVVVRPRDAVRWALYYPPVIDSRSADVKEDSNDPRFYIYRASQLLAVGRVDEATADIDRAQGIDPGNSDASALRSIIAVTQNEKGKALDLAKKAVEADPKSATARIALSYAQQAGFDLPGALRSVEEAVTLGPENALAWARLAELRQSFGRLVEALEAARKASALNPDLSRTQTVLGFSHLTRVETKQAKAAFEKAIGLDQADPLPRLGLGLAKIREGNLEEGRRELEIAITLDPDNGLLRSYLGKAYYEEKRDKLAAGQFDMSKTLDPLDPTPYFYDAIRKQTVNRPVEALQDLQKAIELNDNRAVYRSRLLLDQDLAARSASLGRIYSDLGFQQRALVEGWKSVNTDPSNYSAHRFLADSYSALPRHEIARVSELLQSQLLQPMNITPVQPHLAESNLLAIAGGGPGDISFNEFNPLFNRDRLALQANGIVGEQSTFGEEIVFSGLHKKASFSLGQYHYETDGFRENNDLKDDIVNAFLQVSLSPKTSVQTEYRYRDTEKGDLIQRFFPNDFFPNENTETTSNMLRLGFHHAFSPGSDLLGSFIYNDVDDDLTDEGPFPVGSTTWPTDLKSYSGELQYLWRSETINFVGGAGYVDINGDSTYAFDIFLPVLDPTLPPIFAPFFSQENNEDTSHANVYLYATLNYWKNLAITLGASGDFVESDLSDTFDQDQFNPKLGITWNPRPGTTIRAAAFRVLKRTLITNQTLEPTQVAGFNQFFDDVSSTEYWRYGIAVDQKFRANLYGGLEFSKRDMEVPVPEGSGLATTRVDWDESMVRSYLYWMAHEWLALNAEYQFEHIDRSKDFGFGLSDLDTHRVPLGINFFHPSGFSAMVKGTYFDQNGEFMQNFAFDFENGGDNFWLFDAVISYRLPKRFGIVSVGAKNLFDQSFKYYDTDPVTPAIQPERMFFARFTLSI
jgi:tetratricopeptide (TPR) repeat protein